MKTAFQYLEKLAQPSQAQLARNDSNMDTIRSNNYSLSEKEMAKEASDLIRQNMLRLNIYLEDLSVVEYRQLPAYGLADLFADIGGTLGLWMGISVLTIMELIELIIRLISLLFNSEKELPKGPTNNGSSNNHSQSASQNPLYNGYMEHDGHYSDSVGTSVFDFRRGVESPV
ncbi:hypothetical protein BsWGS_11288 [Bradybaena similaris]